MTIFRIALIPLAAAALASSLLAQPVFTGTEIFPPEEFAARRVDRFDLAYMGSLARFQKTNHMFTWFTRRIMRQMKQVQNVPLAMPQSWKEGG